jgi:hypothetical protein
MSAEFAELDQAGREAFVSAYFRDAGFMSNGWPAERQGLILGGLYEGWQDFGPEDNEAGESVGAG